MSMLRTRLFLEALDGRVLPSGLPPVQPVTDAAAHSSTTAAQATDAVSLGVDFQGGAALTVTYVFTLTITIDDKPYNIPITVQPGTNPNLVRDTYLAGLNNKLSGTGLTATGSGLTGVVIAGKPGTSFTFTSNTTNAAGDGIPGGPTVTSVPPDN